MLDPATLSLFLAASVALVLTPGPDTIYVLTRGVGAGRRVGVRSAAGISAGILVHTTAAVLGLSVLLRTSAVAYAAVKYAGAAYLVYLGVAALRSDEGLDLDAEPSGGGFRRGVLVNVLNPKVALFFLAYLPQFAGAGPGTSARMAALGALYAVLTMTYLSAVGAGAGAVRSLLASRPRVGDALQSISGAVFLALGLRLAAGDAVR